MPRGALLPGRDDAPIGCCRDRRVIGMRAQPVEFLRWQPAQPGLLPARGVDAGTTPIGLLPDHGHIAVGVCGELRAACIARQCGVVEALRRSPCIADEAVGDDGVAPADGLKPHGGDASARVRCDGRDAGHAGIRPAQIDVLRRAPEIGRRIEMAGHDRPAPTVVLEPDCDKIAIGAGGHVDAADRQIDPSRGAGIVDLHRRPPPAASGGEAAAQRRSGAAIGSWSEFERVGRASGQRHAGFDHGQIASRFHQAGGRHADRGEKTQRVGGDGRGTLPIGEPKAGSDDAQDLGGTVRRNGCRRRPSRDGHHRQSQQRKE
ncbi:hypothetical protein GALL_287320 [mine drainage metagenome]|uniref:Uncharacterized protein n=1 Tax=mine drainage metagenome TaxID=410659 RepID=A0A1J5RB63_9ZZZZ